ncbi:MAG: acylneuraminate cytidylyltransferase family protein [Planctomycetota bacterium]
MEVLALIPARGGSKGIPRKNIVTICGKPLIAYAIEQAQASELITRVVVSTEDEEIAEISLKYGAEVPFRRPKEFAQDLSADIDVFRHALQWLKENEGYVPDIVLNHRTVYPIRDVKVIDRAIEFFINNPEADSLRSVRLSLQTPYKMWKIVDKYMEPLLPLAEFTESFNMPRQVLPRAYWQFGYVDMVRTEVITQKRKMSGDKVLPFIIEDEGVDIDHEEDIGKAEQLLKEMQKGNVRSSKKVTRYSV